MKTRLFTALATSSVIFATALSAPVHAQDTKVINVANLIAETGQDQLNFACSHDGYVILNQSHQATRVLKICTEGESIEFSCPSNTSQLRDNDIDCLNQQG